jgi:ABC-type bacteriocin/lantibiotic exporter with double-glycine peptidase domain
MQMKQWATPLGYIQVITGLLASLSLFTLAIYVAKRYTEISLKWNSEIFRHMLSLPEEYFLNRRTGDTISRFNYADGILRASQTSLIKVVVAFVNLAVLFVILMMTNGTLLILAITTAVIAIGVAIAFNPRQRASQQEVQHSTAYTERLLYDLITDFEQIRLEAREQYYLEQISKYESIRVTMSNKLSYLYIREDLALQIIDNSTSVLMLIAAGIVIMSGRLTLGQYAAIDVLLSTSLSPLMNLSGVIRTLQETEVAFKRLGDATNSPIDKRYDTHFQSESFSGDAELVVDMRDVNYSYSAYSPQILRDCKLRLTAEDFPVLIQGDSGAGKSTLARIVSGRIVPSKGELCIFGNDIRCISAKDLSRHILLVDGLPFIRGASIIENLRLGSSAKTERIMEIVERLGIGELPLFSMIDRRVSSSFRELSGGELVLLQIIRCLSQNPDILVLDESISAISPAYRSRVVSGITECCEHAIFISHEVHDTITFRTSYRLNNGRLDQMSKGGMA